MQLHKFQNKNGHANILIIFWWGKGWTALTTLDLYTGASQNLILLHRETLTYLFSEDVLSMGRGGIMPPRAHSTEPHTGDPQHEQNEPNTARSRQFPA